MGNTVMPVIGETERVAEADFWKVIDFTHGLGDKDEEAEYVRKFDPHWEVWICSRGQHGKHIAAIAFDTEEAASRAADLFREALALQTGLADSGKAAK